MSDLYPLRFAPIFRRYLWGGRRLGTVLQKPVGPEPVCAESWELVDRGADQSHVLYGAQSGKSLSELMKTHGATLLGQHESHSRFPLLFKLLDAEQMLSVQVHPNDAQAASMAMPDFGKTEAWVVLAAEPGSLIYAGLRPGVNRAKLESALASGTCEECLHSFQPKVGDCFFLPAGIVHALGAGLLIAEVQQSSDTTFRLFDWNRIDAGGQPRPLHVAQALQVIDFTQGPVAAQIPIKTSTPFRTELVRCEQFVLDQLSIDAPTELGGDDRFHFLLVVEGTVSIAGDPAPNGLSTGMTALIPASVGPVLVSPTGKATLLDVYLP
ncbi:MAG: type I phosphomannose isomerase catalytic subunit [Planctomycetota bacterium]|nr:type I phosphomannose isomerase catalytic subunit [Planctomycetota bacterium]